MSTINNRPSNGTNLANRVANYLRVKGHITPAQFRVVFGAERLAPRILELRNRGYVITTEQARDFNGQSYTRYRLIASPVSCAA